MSSWSICRGGTLCREGTSHPYFFLGRCFVYRRISTGNSFLFQLLFEREHTTPSSGNSTKPSTVTAHQACAAREHVEPEEVTKEFTGDDLIASGTKRHGQISVCVTVQDCSIKMSGPFAIEKPRSFATLEFEKTACLKQLGDGQKAVGLRQTEF